MTPPAKFGDLEPTQPLSLAVQMRLTTSPEDWSTRDGIDFVSAEITATFAERAPATIATGSFVRVDTSRCLEIGYELDNISQDLGLIGGAIDEGYERLANHGIAGGLTSTFLIADEIVVDTYWRGLRIGPALVHLLAEILAVDAVFLIPAALGTRVDDAGVTRPRYDLSRGNEAAQKKVRSAWRRASFRSLDRDVLWVLTTPEHADRARRVLARVERTQDGPAARRWWRRRILRSPK